MLFGLLRDPLHSSAVLLPPTMKVSGKRAPHEQFSQLSTIMGCIGEYLGSDVCDTGAFLPATVLVMVPPPPRGAQQPNEKLPVQWCPLRSNLQKFAGTPVHAQVLLEPTRLYMAVFRMWQSQTYGCDYEPIVTLEQEREFAAQLAVQLQTQKLH